MSIITIIILSLFVLLWGGGLICYLITSTKEQRKKDYEFIKNSRACPLDNNPNPILKLLFRI